MELRPSLLLWGMTAIWIVAAALPAAGFHYFLGVPIGFSIVIGITVVVSVFIGWVFLSNRARMHYSPEADAAFQFIVDEARAVLVKENDSVLQVKGIWSYGYPKVAILFSTNDALRQAKESGLLERIASSVGEKVRGDPAFGGQRETFDRQQAVWVTAENESWHLIVEKSE